MKIVGIGGRVRSGKDTLAELFIKAGYFGFSFGDFTRENSFKRHKDKPDPVSIANMTETSNWLRDTYGPDVILKEAIKQFVAKQKAGEHYMGLVLFSVRAPVEVDWILARGGELIWVEAGEQVRYKRGQGNIRHGEQAQSFDEFKRQEALQFRPQPGIAAEAQMDLEYVKSHATQTLENNGNNITEFRERAKKLVDANR